MAVRNDADIAPLEQIFSGRTSPRYTMDGGGLYVASRLADVRDAICAAGLERGERFLDLGSGDGRVVCLAALIGAKAKGIESDPELHQAAIERAACVIEAYRGSEFALEIELTHGDFLDHPLGDADVVFYYGGGNVRRVKEVNGKLSREMKPGARAIIFRTQKIPDLKMELCPASRPPYFYIYRKG